MALEQVISGGQTGADRAGLIAAKAAGIRTGGWMPLGFLANDGEHPEFAERYGIQEMATRRYPPRTAMNVRRSDGTIRFATEWNSPGELLTLKLCRENGKHFLDITPDGSITPNHVAAWIEQHDIRVLNVAGNAEETSPGINAYVVDFLIEVFRVLRLSAPAA
jgi:hypothetical protein